MTNLNVQLARSFHVRSGCAGSGCLACAVLAREGRDPKEGMTRHRPDCALNRRDLVPRPTDAQPEPGVVDKLNEDDPTIADE